MSFKIELDHIGVATSSLQQNSFFKLLGLSDQGVEKIPSEGVQVGFFRTDNGVFVELLEPLSSDSPVGRFMKKRGPGVHHICFKVQGIYDLVAHLKSQGIEFINEEPRVGGHDSQVVFIHPRSTGGVLVELSEKRQKP